MDTLKSYDLIVIGGGAAGFFGAINTVEAQPGARVLIVEATPRVLTKVKISGGGRCNVTHHLFEARRLVKAYPRGEKELLGPFHRFGPQQTIDWFARHGVELHVEADGRMFPTSNDSETVIEALRGAASRAGVVLETKALIVALHRQENSFLVERKDGSRLETRFLLLATGSMPQGQQLARQLGHRLVEPVPSLFTFEIQHPLLEGLAGQSFASVKAELQVKGASRTFVQEGPALITHWGLSGPAILRLSAFAARELATSSYQAKLVVNWNSAESESSALEALQRTKVEHPKKQIGNENPWACSRRFWEALLSVAGIDKAQTWAQISKKNLQDLVQVFVRSELSVSGKGVFKEEFVTAGGVCREEIDFRSMESRVCPGLYLAGEVIDIDGITGGFNFQNAWTGSWTAAQHIAQRLGPAQA